MIVIDTENNFTQFMTRVRTTRLGSIMRVVNIYNNL